MLRKSLFSMALILLVSGVASAQQFKKMEEIFGMSILKKSLDLSPYSWQEVVSDVPRRVLHSNKEWRIC